MHRKRQYYTYFKFDTIFSCLIILWIELLYRSYKYKFYFNYIIVIFNSDFSIPKSLMTYDNTFELNQKTSNFYDTRRFFYSIF